MEATSRPASSVFPIRPGKRVKTEAVSLPPDIIRMIFSYCPQDAVRSGRVCKRWKAALGTGAALKILLPKISTFFHGVRFTCEQLVNFANRYTEGLPKLDLVYMKPLNEPHLIRLKPIIQKLVIRECNITDTQVAILISKMAKKDATLKVEQKSSNPISVIAIFDALKTHKIQLKKLTIASNGILENYFYLRNAFTKFVNAGGLCPQSCQLSLNVNWFHPSILTCFNQNNIQFSKLKLYLYLSSYGSHFVNEFHNTMAACIQNGLLTEECDFRHVIGKSQGSKRVVQTLLERGIRVKHFNGFSTGAHLESDCEMDSDQREAFFATPGARGLISRCALSIAPSDLIAVTPKILASPVSMTKLLSYVSGGHYNREAFSLKMCDLIRSARWADGYALNLQEDMWDDSILTSLAQSLKRMGHFKLYCDDFLSQLDEPRLTLTTAVFQQFLIALSQRQRSIETFALQAGDDGNVVLNQSVIDTLTEMGRRDFKFHQLTLTDENLQAPTLDLLPFVQSQALSDCVSLTLDLNMIKWVETLQALTTSQIRLLRISIPHTQFYDVLAFFRTHRFKCLLKLKVQFRRPTDKFNPNTIAKRYFEGK